MTTYQKSPRYFVDTEQVIFHYLDRDEWRDDFYAADNESGAYVECWDRRHAQLVVDAMNEDALTLDRNDVQDALIAMERSVRDTEPKALRPRNIMWSERNNS